MKFSILTACHNKNVFIKQCINSVISQSYQNWEMIIVDDCSTDGSYEYLSTVKDSRIKIFRNTERKFCSSTYAEALKHVIGDICGILDGDDFLLSKAMSVIVNQYKKHPKIDYIYSQHFWCDKSGKKKSIGVSSLPKNGRSLAESALAGKHCFSHWRTFRSSLIGKAILFPEGLQFSVDKNLGFTLEELCRGGFLSEPLYNYRYYQGNMSLVSGHKQKQTTKNMAEQFLQKRKEQNITVYPVVELKN